MQIKYNTKYPAIDDLIKKARRKVPKFAFEYLDGGCNEDVILRPQRGAARSTVGHAGDRGAGPLGVQAIFARIGVVFGDPQQLIPQARIKGLLTVGA